MYCFCKHVFYNYPIITCTSRVAGYKEFDVKGTNTISTDSAQILSISGC